MAPATKMSTRARKVATAAQATNVAVADGVLDERERVVMSVGLSLSRALGAEPEVPKLSVGPAN